MKLSIIVPAYNEEDYLATCLRSIAAEAKAMRHHGPIEIVVVDNASTDRTAEVARSVPGVRVVFEPLKGLTRARQRGLDESSGEIVAYVDADTRMPPGWVGRLLTGFERRDDVVCVSGPYVYYDVSVFGAALVRLYWRVLAKPAYWYTGYMAVGGNFAATRRALAQIGGFDTAISFYGEDTNIARRLASAGSVEFDMGLVMQTSARRLKAEGFGTTAWRYALNFIGEVVLKRPLSTDYRDIR